MSVLARGHKDHLLPLSCVLAVALKPSTVLVRPAALRKG